MKIMIPHSRPTLSKAEIKAVNEVLSSCQIAKGKKVEEFESDFCKFQNIRNAVAVNSGTSALHMALLALDIKGGDQVIIPSYSCCAILNAVLYIGADPVITDVNEDDFNISFEAVLKNLTKKTKAIIVVHNFGLPAELAPLKKLGLPIIEDCAHTVGGKYKDKNVGSFGDIGIFSFYATKMMTTAEGGMVASNKASLIDKIKDLIEYDQKRNFKLRYNYKMSDIQAAIGIKQLKQLPGFIDKRQKLAKQYFQLLNESGFTLPKDFVDRKHLYYRYIIKLAKKHNIFNAIKKLGKEGIECNSPVFQPLHRAFKAKGCPVSEKLMKEALSIPIYPSLSLHQIGFVAQKLLKLFN